MVRPANGDIQIPSDRFGSTGIGPQAEEHLQRVVSGVQGCADCEG